MFLKSNNVLITFFVHKYILHALLYMYIIVFVNPIINLCVCMSSKITILYYLRNKNCNDIEYYKLLVLQKMYLYFNKSIAKPLCKTNNGKSFHDICYHFQIHLIISKYARYLRVCDNWSMNKNNKCLKRAHLTSYDFMPSSILSTKNRKCNSPAIITLITYKITLKIMLFVFYLFLYVIYYNKYK